MAKASAVVFDLDGTLACLPVNWEALFEEFKRIMQVDSVRPLVETVSRVDERTKRALFVAWDKAEIAIFQQVTSCGEGLQLYHEFADRSKALVTLQGKAVVKLLLERFNWSFDVVITREETLFRTEQLLMAAGRLNHPITDVLFIGNAESDEAAAAKVGCLFRKVK
jgi:HAD superfamily hydrolase (TIGR01549 family)